MGSGWEKLPCELLLKIQEKLNIYDKIQFYCVCNSWQSVMPTNLLQPFPWLMLPPHLCEATSHRLFDTVDKKTYHLNIHRTTDHGGSLYVRGSSHGWVVAIVESNPRIIYLINPLTGLQKQLPNISWRFQLKEKYILSSNPSLREDYFVIAMYGRYPRLAYTRCGDDKWSSIGSGKCYIDIAFYEGKLYGLTENLELMHIEIGSGDSQVTQISSPSLDLAHDQHGLYVSLVKSCFGLLMVERIAQRTVEGAQDHKTFKTRGFRVHKFDFGLGRWSSSLTDIGENVLFLGRMCSMSISSNDCPKANSNTIYFVDNCVNSSYGEFSSGCFHMGVFDLKTGKFEELPTLKFSLQHIWPWPIWVTPTADF